jgi:hypothetical protein
VFSSRPQTRSFSLGETFQVTNAFYVLKNTQILSFSFETARVKLFTFSDWYFLRFASSLPPQPGHLSKLSERRFEKSD